MTVDETAKKHIESVSEALIRAAAVIATESISSQASRNPVEESDDGPKVQEKDRVYVGDLAVSVGSIIKAEAVKLHTDYHELPYDKKTNVTLGLNSILDLTSPQDATQKQLFGEVNWRLLCKRYEKSFKSINHVNKYSEKILEIENIAKIDMQDARLQAYKLEMTSTRTDEANVYALYAQFLQVLQFHPYLYDNTLNLSEADFCVKLWGPLLEIVFRQSGLRCKWGDTTGDSADVGGSFGLKVDLRIVKDTLSRKRKEADTSNTELAKLGASVGKIAGDRAKLLIESKCVHDWLMKKKSTAQNITIPSLQLVGNKARLYSLRLAASGLYVGVKEASAVIPESISHIKNFQKLVDLLLKFKRASVEVAELYRGGYDNSSSGGSSDEYKQSRTSSKADWIRDTWIPPASGSKKLPALPIIIFANQ